MLAADPKRRASVTAPTFAGDKPRRILQVSLGWRPAVASITIRHLDDDIKQRLCVRAAEHGRQPR
jgi:hypothetical protein